MLKRKVPAVVAAVLLMSSVSAQAFEFADRPGPTKGSFIAPSTLVDAQPREDRWRRQLNNQVVLLSLIAAVAKPANAPRPVIQSEIEQVVTKDRPGRLSPEFSTVERGLGIRFEYGPGEVSSWLKPTATHTVMKFEDRPGSISKRIATSAAVSIIFGHGDGFTSSITKAIARPGMRPRPGSVGFCVGSMAPCGVLRFGEHFKGGSLSAAYSNERW